MKCIRILPGLTSLTSNFLLYLGSFPKLSVAFLASLRLIPVSSAPDLSMGV